MCQIQFHFLLFILISIGFCLVIFHNSSFVILSVHFILIIRLKLLFTNVCNLLVIWLVVFQVSQAYNDIDFTFVLNIPIMKTLPNYMFLPLTFWHRSFTFNSNKSTTCCNNFSVYYPDVCLQLNMFRAFSRPSSGAQ